VLGERSEENLNLILQFMRIFVEDKNLSDFKRRYNWFMSIAESMPQIKGSMLVLDTRYLMARTHFEFDEFKKAKALFEELKTVFKTKELFLQVFECDLYLLACNLSLEKEVKAAEFNSAYDKIMEAGKVPGLSLHGRSIGQLEKIIGEILWPKGTDFK